MPRDPCDRWPLASKSANRYLAWLSDCTLTHADTVRLFERSKDGSWPTSTKPLLPLKLNAWSPLAPVTPGAKVTPVGSVPLFLSRKSLALPSPFHRLTSPAGRPLPEIRSVVVPAKVLLAFQMAALAAP